MRKSKDSPVYSFVLIFNFCLKQCLWHSFTVSFSVIGENAVLECWGEDHRILYGPPISTAQLIFQSSKLNPTDA